MAWRLGVPVCIVALTAAACSSSSAPTPPPTSAGPTVEELWSRITIDSSESPAEVGSEAVIDGFRVHPDPDDDGVIHVVSGQENVVVNATDIASFPPGPASYLVVNWGDGPNQRVGCGPCRADHDYAPGRYTLVASLDGTDRDRSITIQVQVSAPREKKTDPTPPPPRFQSFGFVPETLAFHGTGFLVTPFPLPSGVTVTQVRLSCRPLLTILPNFLGQPQAFPGGLGIPIFANRRGTCTYTLSGSDANGPYTETSTLTVE